MINGLSHKQFKRRVLFAFAGWLILICGSLYFFTSSNWQQALEQGRNIGRSSIDKDHTARLWNASHGGIYVQTTKVTPPNPHLSHVVQRDLTTTTGLKLTMVNPAYMLRQLHEIEQRSFAGNGHITSLKPLRPENQPDVWESLQLKKFASGSKETSELIEMKNGQLFMRVMRPFITEPSCLKCHRQQGYNVGDIRGGISVSVPMAKIISATRQKSVFQSIYHLILLMLGILVLYLYYSLGKKHLDEISENRQTQNLDKKMIQGVFDNTESGIAVYSASADGEQFFFQAMNSAGVRNCNVDRSSIIGKEVREIFPDIVKIGLFAVFQRVWQTGQPQSHPVSNYNDDRVSLWVENKVFNLPSGEIVAIFDDLTIQKQAEAELLKSQENWHQTFDAIPDIITILDTDFNVIQANQATYDHFAALDGKIIGKKCYELFCHHSSPDNNCPVRQTIADFQPHSNSNIMQHNQNRNFHITSAPILDKKGKLLNIVHSARDISVLQKLEEELFQTRKLEAIGTLAGGVAHDFNNILTVIRGHAELALMIEDGTNPCINDLNEINAAAERATQLTRQLLAFSRKEKISPEILQINPLIEQLTKMLNRLIGDDIDLEIDPLDNPATSALHREPPPILADRGQIEQVIINLVVNAADAVRDTPLSCGRRVKVSTGATATRKLTNAESNNDPAPELYLKISDNGSGISAEVLPHIFDPFFTTKESGKGTGLGLATVHGIIEQNHGKIEVESQPGQGTTFTIYWPGVKSGSDIDRKAVKKELIPGGNETILVAEDNPETLNLVCTALQRQGYKVLKAHNGADALKQAQTYPGTIDLLFSDLIMPKLGGIELAEELLLLYPESKLILTSGYLGDQIDPTNETLLNATFLDKPYKIPELMQAIRKLLDHRNEVHGN